MGEIAFPNWDPVIFSLGPLAIRWYGAMYVVAFFVAQYVLTRLARARFLPLAPERVPDLIIWLVIGVLLGGRIGYCLFYQPELMTSWRMIAVWEGGLSFHGGLLGAFAMALVFSRRQGVSTWRLCDALVLAVTPGIFFVRIANFINGELYGRVTDESVAWAMRFPTDPKALSLMGVHGHLPANELAGKLKEAIDGGKWDEIKAQVDLRHPSQIYEAVGEGLLVGCLLYLFYRMTRDRGVGKGVFGGLFLIGYGVVRFLIEFYRQPDSQFEDKPGELGTVLGPFSMGQVLCMAMILCGGLLIWWKHDDRPEMVTESSGVAGE